MPWTNFADSADRPARMRHMSFRRLPFHGLRYLAQVMRRPETDGMPPSLMTLGDAEVVEMHGKLDVGCEEQVDE